LSDAAIVLRDLRKSYGSTCALAGVSLAIEPGQVVGYVGANGAGKTTTVKIIAGLIKPSSGTALVCGRDIREEPLAAKARLGYLPETGALFEKLTPREYLEFTGHLQTMDPRAIEDRSRHWLGYFHLEDRADDPISALSRGNKQKVCWASALLHDPDVLILDEPLTGLDVETVSRLKGLLRELAAAGKTIFYSSHMIDVVERICTRVAVLHRGRLLATGSPAELITSTGESSLERALLELWRAADVE